MPKLLLVGLACLVLSGCEDQPRVMADVEERAVIAHNRRVLSSTNPVEICLINFGHTVPCNNQLSSKSEDKQQRWALIRNEILPVDH